MRWMAVMVVTVLVAAGCGTDEPQEGDTQVQQPVQPPGMQEPHYPEAPPVRDTVPQPAPAGTEGAISPEGSPPRP
jgi:hypothetical protein